MYTWLDRPQGRSTGEDRRRPGAAETGEDHAVSEYEQHSVTELPAEVWTVVQRQATEVRQATMRFAPGATLSKSDKEDYVRGGGRVPTLTGFTEDRLVSHGMTDEARRQSDDLWADCCSIVLADIENDIQPEVDG